MPMANSCLPVESITLASGEERIVGGGGLQGHPGESNFPSAIQTRAGSGLD